MDEPIPRSASPNPFRSGDRADGVAPVKLFEAVTSRDSGGLRRRPDQPGTTEARLRPERVLTAALVVTAVLGLLSLAGQLVHYLLPEFPFRDFVVWTLWVDHEQSLPTLFSVLLLTTCAVAGLAASLAAAGRMPAEAPYWRAIAVVFAYLTLDEFLGLHERLGSTSFSVLDASSAWLVPAGVAVVITTAVFARFVFGLPPTTRNLIITSGALYVGGAIGFELLAAWYVSGDPTPEAQRVGPWQGLGYVPISATEEALEMVGASVFLYAVLVHLQDRLGGVTLRIER